MSDQQSTTWPEAPARPTTASPADGLRAGGSVVAFLVLVTGLVAIGGLVVLPPSSSAYWLAAAPAFLVLAYFALKGPKWSLAAIIVSVVFGLSNTSISAGGLDLRVTDFFYVLLAVWVFVLRARDGQRGYLVGRRMLGLWLLLTGFSLYPLFVQGTGTQEAVVSWLRLAATFSLVWLVPYAVRTVKDVNFTLGVLALATTTQVGVSAAINIGQGKLDGRLSGANTPNSTGMLAVLILVLALHGPVPRHRGQRWVMVIVGSVGLLMTRSLASTAAAVIVLGVYGLRRVYRGRDRGKSGLLTPSRILVMLAIGLIVAAFLRPTNLPGADGFGDSTTVHRLVLADAGLHLFAQDPITGVGWHNTPFHIGSESLHDELRSDWGGDVNPDFFPLGPQGASVHNSYVQMLAETGLVGFLAFLAAFVCLAVGVTRVMRTVSRNRMLYLCMRATLVMVVVIVLWLNDNPLFGAQPETVLIATFLGLFAAAPAVMRDTAPQEELSASP